MLFTDKLDREGGKPIEMIVKKIDKNGFTSNHDNGFLGNQQNAQWNFVPPCLAYATFSVGENTNSDSVNEYISLQVYCYNFILAVHNFLNLIFQEQLAENPSRKDLWIFICVPVSPGNCRLISVFPRNFGNWMGPNVTRWIHHTSQNLVIDSDLYLLHVEVNLNPLSN